MARDGLLAQPLHPARLRRVVVQEICLALMVALALSMLQLQILIRHRAFAR